GDQTLPSPRRCRGNAPRPGPVSATRCRWQAASAPCPCLRPGMIHTRAVQARFACLVQLDSCSAPIRVLWLLFDAEGAASPLPTLPRRLALLRTLQATGPANVRDEPLCVVGAAQCRRLRLPLMTSLLQDRRHRRIRHKALPPLRIPIEQHPHTVLLIGIAEDLRSLRPMLPTLVRALRREDPLKLVEILDLRCRQHHGH